MGTKDRLNPTIIRKTKLYKTKKIDYSLTLFQLYIKYKGKCQECGITTVYGQHPPIDKSATIEHLIPLSAGGNHVSNNVTLLCQNCNFSKNRAAQIDKNKLISYKKLFSIFGYEIYYRKGESDGRDIHI